MQEALTLGAIKLIQDEDGYGVAHLKEDESWEVIANFKNMGDFITFIIYHLKELQDRENTLMSIHEQVGTILEKDTPEEEENNG